MDNNVLKYASSKYHRDNPEFQTSVPYYTNKNNFDSDINSIEEAKNKIRELEIRIKQLEGGNPRRFPDVKFLNYRTRKRILVSSQLFYLN